MILIKITIIIAIIYGVLRWGLHVYIKQLSYNDKIRVKLAKYTKKETIYFIIVGLMNLLFVLLAAISIISLVIYYL